MTLAHSLGGVQAAVKPPATITVCQVQVSLSQFALSHCFGGPRSLVMGMQPLGRLLPPGMQPLGHLLPSLHNRVAIIFSGLVFL